MLGRYLAYCNNSETPHAYDFWTGLWVLSCTLGRGVVVDRPSAPVYLNVYAILVAESGVTRKSTAVRRAVKLLRAVGHSDTLLIETKSTPELIEFKLAQQTLEMQHAYAAIAIDELVKFLGKEQYTMGMPTLLTDLYDAPAIRTGGGSIIGGSNELRNVYINFLSASTPSWLVRAVNPDVIEGGFTSRVVFIVAEEPKRTASWPEPPDEAAFHDVVTMLGGIRDKAKQIRKIGVSDGARKRFGGWYNSREHHRDPFRASFQSREDGHVLRLAALLAINNGSWEVQSNDIIAAIKVVTEAREDGARIFEGTGTNSKMVMGLDALRDKLLAAGTAGIKQGELTKHLQRYMDAKLMTAALDIFHDLGMVQKFADIQIGRGRPTTLWRATSALLSTKALDLAIERIK